MRSIGVGVGGFLWMGERGLGLGLGGWMMEWVRGEGGDLCFGEWNGLVAGKGGLHSSGIPCPVLEKYQ